MTSLRPANLPTYGALRGHRRVHVCVLFDHTVLGGHAVSAVPWVGRQRVSSASTEWGTYYSHYWVGPRGRRHDARVERDVWVFYASPSLSAAATANASGGAVGAPLRHRQRRPSPPPVDVHPSARPWYDACGLLLAATSCIRPAGATFSAEGGFRGGRRCGAGAQLGGCATTCGFFLDKMNSRSTIIDADPRDLLSHGRRTAQHGCVVGAPSRVRRSAALRVHFPARSLASRGSRGDTPSLMSQALSRPRLPSAPRAPWRRSSTLYKTPRSCGCATARSSATRRSSPPLSRPSRPRRRGPRCARATTATRGRPWRWTFTTLAG